MYYEAKQKIFKNEWPYFPFKERKLLNKYDRLKKVAKMKGLSKKALLRLDWIIYYYTKYKKQ